MVSRSRIASILDDYEDITIATVCSHSSLQIFHGAREEGFRTLGIAVGKQPKFYDAFPLARPDEFLVVDAYKDIPEPGAPRKCEITHVYDALTAHEVIRRATADYTEGFP